MKHLLLCTIGLLCLVQSPLFAQKTPKTYNFKAYLELSPTIINEKQRTDTSDFSQEQFSMGTAPRFAFEIMRENKRFWQFRLGSFYVGHNNTKLDKIDPVQQATFVGTGAKTTSISGAIVTEYGVPIKYNADKKQNFWLSIALNEYASGYRVIPFTTAQFPFSEINIGTRIGLIPRWQRQISEKISLEINLPYFFGDAYYEFRHFENPILPRFAQKVRSFEFDWTPRDLNIMLGMSIKI